MKATRRVAAVAIACALISFAAPVASVSAADSFDGKIVEVDRESNQDHRVYVRIGSGNKDSEHCTGKLAKKRLTLNTDTNSHTSGWGYFYFTWKRYARIAFRQAMRHLGELTWRVQCFNES